MNGNNKTFLLCGIILALITAFGVFTAISKMENLVPVVVATDNIEPHEEITEKKVRIEEVPAIGRSELAVDDVSLVVGGYSTTKIFAGQTILHPMVAKQFDETGASGVAMSIPNGSYRAVSFPATADNCFGGKVKKGDLVDIVVTLDGGQLGTDTSITKIVAQGVEVFDIIGGEGENLRGLTFLLPFQEIELLTHAFTIGSVSYALNPMDAKVTPTEGVINASVCKRFNFRCTK